VGLAEIAAELLADERQVEVDAQNPAQKTERLNAEGGDVDLANGPVTVGHHHGFAVEAAHAVPKVVLLEQIEIDAASRDFKALGEDFLLEEALASGAIDHDSVEKREAGEEAAEGALFLGGELPRRGLRFRDDCGRFGLAALAHLPPEDGNEDGQDVDHARAHDPRQIADAECGGEDEQQEAAEVLAGAAILVGAEEAQPGLVPGGAAEDHPPVGLLEKQEKERQHRWAYGIADTASGSSADSLFSRISRSMASRISCVNSSVCRRLRPVVWRGGPAMTLSWVG